MQQIVSQDVWENEYIMEEVRRIADETPIEGGKCFCYSAFHIFTEVIRVGISLAVCCIQIVVFKLLYSNCCIQIVVFELLYSN